MPTRPTEPHFAASLVQQTVRARHPITPVAFSVRYCPDVVTRVPPRFVAYAEAYATKRPTFEELEKVGDMMLSEPARESPFTMFYFLSARGLAKYAYVLDEEKLNSLGRFWGLIVGDKFEQFIEKHMVTDEDQAKFRALLETVDELYTVYVDKSYLPTIELD